MKEALKLDYSEFMQLAQIQAEKKGISYIFEKEANFVETGYGRKAAENIFKRFAIITRYFNAVENVDTSVELFGEKLSMPILPSALSRLTDITDKPIHKIAAASKALSIMTFIGVSGEQLIGEIASIGVPTVKIMKPYRDFEKMKSMVLEANKHKITAIGVDIDLSFGKKSADRLFYQNDFSPKKADQIFELVKMAEMPFIIKGILSVEDAIIAKEIGCKAIIVTNHGNMTIDHLVQPIEVLPRIREAIDNEMKIIVEGGITRGSDIFKCLALGADAVCVGRMTWIGLIVNEVEGVVDIFNILNDELKRYMQSTGAKNLKGINSSMLFERNFIID
jgi:4-hydroxymandelate oxidase